MLHAHVRRLAALALTFATAAAAQTYPNHPVRIMVGANAGGGTDITTTRARSR